MRIAQIMLGKGFGGAERSFVDTTLALASRGHSVLAVCHRQFSALNLLQGVKRVELFTVNARGEWDFFTPRKIAKALIDFETEVAHTQLKRAAWHGGRAAQLAGIPVVSKLHNYVELKRYKYVSHLIGTTEDQRRHALEKGWPESRISVIPNFSRISPIEHVRREFQKPISFLSYGRYVEKKGFDVLLRAFAKIIEEGFEVTLKIGGRGPMLDDLQKLAEELGITEYVVLGEWYSDVVEVLDAADAFILPSLDEPFGIVMLEAMARGVPIITTDTKGPSEVLSAETALFCEIGSAESLYLKMRAFVEGREAAMVRAECALEHYRGQYYENAVLPQIEDVYREVIERSCS